MKRRTETGFTLAEVLITLGIIGVVAAMTIPTLINNYQKTQYVTKLKKAYAQFNQVLTQLSTDQGCINDLECTGLFTTDTNVFGDEIVKYFKVAKNCRLTSGCFPSDININDNYDGSGTSDTYDNWSSGFKFITLDNTMLTINVNAGCSGSWSSHYTNDLNQICGVLAMDVNGFSGPNFRGRDIFVFYITNGHGPKLYPVGGADDMGANYWKTNSFCNSAHNHDNTCAARIMEEGWQMNY